MMKRIILTAVIILLIIAAIGFYLYKQSTYTYVTAKFQELRPIHGHISVYYKGIKIGKAFEKKHSHDYQHSLVKIALFDPYLKLPENTKVLLKREKRCFREYDFMELVLPKNPVDKFITQGSILEGKTMIDKDSYLANLDPDMLKQIETNLLNSTENLNTSLENLSDLFVLLQDVIKENKGNITKTTANLDKLTTKIDTAIKQETLESTITSLETTTKNLNTLTQSINANAMPAVDTTLCNTQGMMANLNVITCGIRNTLGKRFGGLRILFGKTVNECECKPCRQ